MKVTTVVEAEFIGDSRDSQFVKGNIYNIEVLPLFFGRIQVNPTHGYDYKRYHGFSETYKSLAEFLHNWATHKPLHVNYWDGSQPEIS